VGGKKKTGYSRTWRQNPGPPRPRQPTTSWPLIWAPAEQPPDRQDRRDEGTASPQKAPASHKEAPALRDNVPASPGKAQTRQATALTRPLALRLTTGWWWRSGQD
jgi:hypothetical protein